MRFAIAGYGYIAHFHARAVQAAGGEIAAVMGRDPEKIQAFCDEHSAQQGVAIQACTSVAELPPVDAIVVALPNSLHLPVCLEALDHGFHVLVEKPMALDGRECRLIADKARAVGKQLLVGHMWRYDPQALWLRDAIARGEVGEVVKTKSYGIHVNWGPGGWFVDKTLAGGGALIDMGVHAIDTTRFVIGDPRPTRVFAKLDTRHGPYEVDDFGVLVIEWDNNVTSIVESGWWNAHMDGPEASTQVFGTKGYARLFPNEIRRLVGGEVLVEQPSFPRRAEHCDQEIYTAQMVGFVESITSNTPPYADAAVGTVVMDICDAAYRSAATGRAVDLET